MLENNLKFEINLKKVFEKFNNIKFLGSGINYLVAKNMLKYLVRNTTNQLDLM